jgi:hypothetical protein
MSIPNVPSLSKLIHHGSEGGQEFARILNQLLFEDSQLCDYYFQSYSDSAGDFKGVDALMEKGLKKIGLQYKFFEGNPKNNKSDLKKSLFNAIENFRDMDEWILVTPDNFTRQGMTWLEEISSLTTIKVKHWGHSEILAFMLKFPQIGKKYYSSKVFRNYNTHIDREPTKSEINDFFNQFNNPEIDGRIIFLQAQPNLIDFKKVFSDDIYKEVSDSFHLLYRDVFDFDESLNSKKDGGLIRVGVSTIDDMRNGVDKLPGGMSMVLKEYNCFQPNVVFYSLKVGGMSYSVWCFVNGRWVFIPKPWRVIYSVYGLRQNKGINKLIWLLSWFGYGKYLRNKNSGNTKMLVNRIIHGLISKNSKD